jgi:hypothetical protein
VRALPYLFLAVAGLATFVRVRMSVRRAGRAAEPDETDPGRGAARQDVRVEEDGGVRSARARLRPRP